MDQPFQTIASFSEYQEFVVKLEKKPYFQEVVSYFIANNYT